MARVRDAADVPHVNSFGPHVLKSFRVSGEASPLALRKQLERSFGRSGKHKMIFVLLLPRYAIQGLPLILRTAFRPIGRLFRSGESDLEEWENEGGAQVPVWRHRLVH